MLDGTVIVKQLHSFIQEHEICVQRNLELQQEVDDLNYMVENLKLERDYTRTKYRRLKAHLVSTHASVIKYDCGHILISIFDCFSGSDQRRTTKS